MRFAQVEGEELAVVVVAGQDEDAVKRELVAGLDALVADEEVIDLVMRGQGVELLGSVPPAPDEEVYGTAVGQITIGGLSVHHVGVEAVHLPGVGQGVGHEHAVRRSSGQRKGRDVLLDRGQHLLRGSVSVCERQPFLEGAE